MSSVHLTPPRVAAYFTAASALIGALAVPIANLDWSSSAGVIAGVIAILGAYNTWAKGQRAHEARQAGEYDPAAEAASLGPGEPVAADEWGRETLGLKSEVQAVAPKG